VHKSSALQVEHPTQRRACAVVLSDLFVSILSDLFVSIFFLWSDLFVSTLPVSDPSV